MHVYVCRFLHPDRVMLLSGLCMFVTVLACTSLSSQNCSIFPDNVNIIMLLDLRHDRFQLQSQYEFMEARIIFLQPGKRSRYIN
jgi:hypothetical protein